MPTHAEMLKHYNCLLEAELETTRSELQRTHKTIAGLIVMYRDSSTALAALKVEHERLRWTLSDMHKRESDSAASKLTYAPTATTAIEAKDRMKSWLLASTMASTLVVGMAQAEDIDGNALLRACRLVVTAQDGGRVPTNQEVEFGYCLGLIEGVRSTMVMHNNQLPDGYKTCFPSTGITNGQAARIVVKYLDNHPEMLNKDSTFPTLYAYRFAYPCQ